MAEEVRKLDFGRVIAETFDVIRRHGIVLVALVLLLAVLPSAILAFANLGYLGADGVRTNPFAALTSPFYIPGGLIVGLLAILGAAMQLSIALADLEGRRVDWREALRISVRKMLPLYGLAIVMILGVMFGFVLLIIPGVIVAVMWSVAFPTLLAETSNVFKALNRSRELTKGNRWRIFGLVVLLWIALIVVQGFMTAFTGVFASAGAFMVGILVSAVINLLYALVVGVGSAALYVQLRELKGSGRESVAQVFS